MTLPAIRALRIAYPESNISLLVKPSVSPIFEMNPDIDEIILYKEDFKGMFGKLRLAIDLRKRHFSSAILLQNAFDAALITFLAGIPQRIGYSRDKRGFFLTKPIPFDDDDRKMHHIDYYLHLLKAAGINAEYSDPWIYLSIDERLSARDKLSLLKRPILGINPGATYGSSKRWFPERFAQVANWFLNETGGGIAIFGSNNEVDIAEEIAYLIRRQRSEVSSQTDLLLNLAGKTSIRELISVISECDVLVTNDSGPMHIGYAVGTPIVVVFGSTSPDLTGPVGDGHIVVKTDLSCSPCFNRTCKNNDMRCMYTITPEDVYWGIKELLPVRKAVFFDRDGTLCKDADYLNNWRDFEVYPDIDRLTELKRNGFLLIGVSNQSGIGRGIVDERFVKEVNQVFVDRYGFDDFYYCPHMPDDSCACRKPEPKMLLDARVRHKINLKKSYVVGDKDVDMLLAKAVGAIGVLVKTGKQQWSAHADFVVETLKDVVDLILSHE
ncbi:lipopolysaccharide heptosyltransferase II [Dissulfurispira thermophila]|uniref:lipopolysaccharide heptosyltransferase II n=2 Tax=root TaxID=1 RepID=A0A7G1H2F9_9BACT|nr:lipopolysaccharide heptosyltransferase II [Dissulfurispira thermophila]